MKNYIQPGDAVDIVAPANVTSGQGLLVGDMFGVCGASALSGEDVALHRCGVYELPKLEAQAWTVGQKVYWDDTNARLTSVASGNKLVGCAVLAAANPSTTGRVVLDNAIR